MVITMAKLRMGHESRLDKHNLCRRLRRSKILCQFCAASLVYPCASLLYPQCIRSASMVYPQCIPSVSLLYPQCISILSLIYPQCIPSVSLEYSQSIPIEGITQFRNANLRETSRKLSCPRNNKLLEIELNECEKYFNTPGRYD